MAKSLSVAAQKLIMAARAGRLRQHEEWIAQTEVLRLSSTFAREFAGDFRRSPDGRSNGGRDRD
ncbi:hypothetical protein [Methylocella sp.]|uniref:hypothetical protein n=1 Tax=Methylocella sp. TaxID=1978226 RepID=UPI0037842A42